MTVKVTKGPEYTIAEKKNSLKAVLAFKWQNMYCVNFVNATVCKVLWKLCINAHCFIMIVILE